MILQIRYFTLLVKLTFLVAADYIKLHFIFLGLSIDSIPNLLTSEYYENRFLKGVNSKTYRIACIG